MTDDQIVDLYWQRSQSAVEETEKKYGTFCLGLACRILQDRLNAEECVNDAYLRLWNAIPPARPQKLRPFLGKILRNLALNRYERETAEKRGGGAVALALEELAGCIPADESPERKLEEKEIRACISAFLKDLKKQDRMIFLMRYWELLPVAQIAKHCGGSESKIKMSLYRSRMKLKMRLEKEGVIL